MQPLGLTGAEQKRYVAHLLGSHNFTIRAEVLTTSGAVIQSIRETLLDGQVNIQPDGPVRRTASLTFFDPDRRLHFDPDSPFGSTLFLDRMIRITHTVKVPGIGRVTCTPFIGPVTKVSRDGETVAVECQDKASFATRGRPPITARKGANAVASIRRIMAATGENRFRLPDQNTRRLTRSYSVGWSDEASPWVVASKIAAAINLQLGYSCDGYLTLRPMPSKPAVRLTGKHVTDGVKVDYDATAIYNTVRVEGTLKPKKKPKSEKTKETKAVKVAVTATLKPRNPVSPVRLGRNGNPRYLPLLVEGTEFKKQADAGALARRLLGDGQRQTTAGASVTAVPLFHLDVDDLIAVDTDTTSVRLRLSEGSIPLGIGGDMTIGQQRRVSGGRRA